ncbi:MAG: primosomal protein N' [Oscillospiraceae bacterium]|nr:primosomal protein N' [Oscillospiraceae bacterium]
MRARVAVETAIYAIDKPYTYLVPADWNPKPGMRVLVPFGRGNRATEGMLLSLEEGDGEGLKAVAALLDPEPLLEEGTLKLAAFLRERYFCTFYDAIKAMLPAGLWFRAEDTYEIVPDTGWREKLAGQQEQLALMEAVEGLGGSAAEGKLRSLLGGDRKAELQTLSRRGFLTVSRTVQRKNLDKTETLLSLAVPSEEAAAFAAAQKRRAPMQAAVLELLCVTGSVSQKELCYFTGASLGTIKRLSELGYVRELRQEVLRSAYRVSAQAAAPLVLNPDQREVCESLRQRRQRETPGVALLYGVTGSGKTAVYLSLIQDCLAEGRSAMLLVPEISLTPQLVELLTAHFGTQVAVLHSSLRIGERYDEWKRIRTGDASVVVGTRSAVFAPLRSLGLLILDEEHEHSYKSENSPRYHAREVAIYRGNKEHALVLLGSATPSVESMYRARHGQYSLYTLMERYNGRALPAAELVDMKLELRAGNGSALSRGLRDALLHNEGRQAILFLNRRGTSRMMVCVDCGDVPQCPNCSVNLTYHRANGRLMCHYCGHSQPVPQNCPQCGGHLKTVGFGTQRVQAELEALLPGKEILRMDADTVTATNSHEAILTRFREENLPVLVGTQMVTKGLNFPNVNLVGVLDADAALYMENFRAAETAFSIITQVVGRSGRGTEDGRALIQTMTPENPVLQLAARQDYDGFYALELPLRQLRGCPPFADLITLTFSGPFECKAEEASERFRGMLEAALPKTTLQMRILGPAPAPVARVCGRYRYRLTLSLQATREARGLVAYLLREFSKEKSGVGVFADLNSYE